MARGRTNDTDREVEQHLQSARRSVRSAMDAIRGSAERGFRVRRAERDLLELEDRMRNVGSVVNPYGSDLDLAPEESRADILRQRREERREAKRKEAPGVTDGG